MACVVFIPTYCLILFTKVFVIVMDVSLPHKQMILDVVETAIVWYAVSHTMLDNIGQLFTHSTALLMIWMNPLTN